MYQIKPFRKYHKNKSLDSYSIEEVIDISKSIAKEFKGKVQYCKNDISGACITFRKELWGKLKGFDEDFFPAYGEDTNFYDKILGIGLKLVWCQESYVHHIGEQTARIVPDLNRAFTSNLYFQKIKERKLIERQTKHGRK